MIELVIASRCTGCTACVTACPRDVFDPVPDGPPRIARQADCQTCFLCELYCREDALYVHPDAGRARPQDAAAIEASGLLGEYRRASGWDEWAGNEALRNQHWRMEDVFRRARDA
ncbi:ferredoxin [Gluconacetobacter johannae DSM 13595]|uniref:Ferredoxin family protein n=1 Tax=Gluconacetobacter johannae TaxID=112140 RepID=A0A7W4P295_9PROT|nr:ferredoxin family protein [Gluconacetobacter johannae]MBB2174896.1 ferredoxin family protein [Gluconacetobacter johannae]GBQ87693.1 ferredoxin [Gluconacetobacter johannae DSM 13595]